MNIKVNVEKLLIDGREVKTADLNQELLDEIVGESLLGNVVYELEGDHPIVKFFETLQEGTKEGSALRQKMDEAHAARAEAEKDDSEKTEADDNELQEISERKDVDSSQQ